jgi:hypothetical protein
VSGAADWAKRLTTVCLMLALASPAGAQYFGRNKVRYRAFDFQVLKTEHFDIYFYSREREGADIAARLAERWYARLERLFAHSLSGRQPLILYASHADFEQTNVVAELLGEGTGGLTEPIRRRIVLPLAGPIADTDHVLGHELVHAFQFDMTSEASGRSADSALSALPLWFIEGMAEYLSLGSIDANTAMKLRDAMRRDRLPSIRDLDAAGYFPYQWGHAVLAYVAGRYGDETIPRLLKRSAAAGSVEAAIRSVLDTTSQDLSREWHDAIRSAYAPVIAASLPIGDAYRPLIRAEGLGADLNVGPALSPNGRWIAFQSSRSLFSIDLFVADAVSGRVLRKLTSTATDPHFSSIGFIHSAGAWDPASERIAMATIVGSHPALTIFDARTGRRSRDIELSSVDEVLHPAWSPDGNLIAFTAMHQGLTDVFVYDLRTAAVKQITSDAYADLQPAWARDSRHLVFSSDRFSSELQSLRVGALHLVIVDTVGGIVEPIAGLPEGKHINPQWSPDGDALYFIGDRDGISNLYRLTLATHHVDQLTALDTGVSGITPSSPALSVSSDTSRLAIGVFEDDKYSIYVRDTLPPGPAAITTVPVNAAALPPANRVNPVMAALVSQPEKGLPPSEPYPAEPYKPTLSLVNVGQPTAGVGVGRFGTAASGGAALVFADTLGDHLLATAFQITTGMTGSFSASDIAFETGYLNIAGRWNWGVTGGQAPYVTGVAGRGVARTPAGDAVMVDEQLVYRETERSVSGILAYPFDRVRRVEFRGGLSRTSFEETLKTKTSSVKTGAVLTETKETREVAPHLDLAIATVALVSDSANFGPTGPVQGQRYRFEISPALGSINFTGVLLDYRRYVMPISFWTIAGRVMHYGRYGAGGDDTRLYPVYINNPAFVRGYDWFADDAECGGLTATVCQPTGRFVGSRMLVGNLEVRFPLLRPFGVSRKMYGPGVPIEIALFGDSGVAWTARERPAFAGGTRPGIASAGVAVRGSLGFFVAEFDVTRPFQLAGRGWVYSFNVLPGW